MSTGQRSGRAQRQGTATGAGGAARGLDGRPVAPDGRGGSREERAARTRRALLDAARRLFVERGYFDTGTEDIVAAAGVGTRGALYHHFADKQALFLAVLHEVQGGIGAAAAGRITGDDPLERLASALRAFLDSAAEDGEVSRILLVDGPAVLGWEAWRALEADYGVQAIEAQLRAAVDAGAIEDQALRPLAHLVLALVDEAALYIANAPDRAAARAEVGASIDRLLDGLRVCKVQSSRRTSRRT